jgi:hypothetical protein
MIEMNYWQGKHWDMQDDLCPCDNHFNEWIEAEGIRGQSIYHLGTGTHHVVGLRQSELGNRVFAITASKEEYDAYIKLVTENVRVAKNYLCYFGDIYLSNAVLLPEFDVVTLFHLCEFFYPNTAGKDYGGLTDRGVLDLLTKRTRRNGYILFYTKSMSFETAAPIIEDWETACAVERLREFKTLLVYRKLA